MATQDLNSSSGISGHANTTVVNKKIQISRLKSVQEAQSTLWAWSDRWKCIKVLFFHGSERVCKGNVDVSACIYAFCACGHDESESVLSVCVCVDEDIRVSRAMAGLECWRGLGDSTGRKEVAVCLKCTHKHTLTHPHIHSPPFLLPWPLLLLYVWHAALKPQLRGTTLSTWGFLYLYITLFASLCLTSLLPHSLPELWLYGNPERTFACTAFSQN